MGKYPTTIVVFYCCIVLLLLGLYYGNYSIPSTSTASTALYENFKNERKTYSFYNKWHYGDNILNLKFFYVMAPVLKKNGIRINYYYDASYIKNVDELERYVDKSVVRLYPITILPLDAIELWMSNNIMKGGKTYTHRPEFDVYYNAFYENIASILRIPVTPAQTSLYQNETYLPVVYTTLDAKFKNLDILVINAKPQSSQFVYDEGKMNELCLHLKKKNYNIATTGFVADSIPCTMTSGLKMQDIGAISTRCKYIICSFTGPSTACFNRFTKEYVKNWFVFQDSPLLLTELNNVHYITSDKFNTIYSFF